MRTQRLSGQRGDEDEDTEADQDRGDEDTEVIRTER